MPLTVDWENRVVALDESITDIKAFKDALRVLESSAKGILYPPILTYKQVNIGGGAELHFVDLINGYRMQFPVAGNYQIIGNINADIVPVDGVYVERLKATAFATTGGGSGGLSVEQNAMLAGIHALLSNIEGGMDHATMMRIILAGVAGKREGIGTDKAGYLSADGSKVRIEFTQEDEFGNGGTVIDGTV